MKKIKDSKFEGERSLYFLSDAGVVDCHFENGESPLKECRNIEVSGCTFAWKYPLWNCTGVSVLGTKILVTARSGIWYTNDIKIVNSEIEAPKTFRRCGGVTLIGCNIPNAEETLWSCRDIVLNDVTLSGDYFGMGCDGVTANNLEIYGNYAFDGAKNIEINHAKLISKDAFWNCENVVVRDSVIVGEYLGWNSKNLTFINCKIESNQGLCYIENLTLDGCDLTGTDLAFEYCRNVKCDLVGSIISIKNPTSGSFSLDKVGEIILDPAFCEPDKIKITMKNSN